MFLYFYLKFVQKSTKLFMFVHFCFYLSLSNGSTHSEFHQITIVMNKMKKGYFFQG